MISIRLVFTFRLILFCRDVEGNCAERQRHLNNSRHWQLCSKCGERTDVFHTKTLGRIL